MRRVERVLLLLQYGRELPKLAAEGGSQSKRRGDGDVSVCGAQNILVAFAPVVVAGEYF
jgi:hypothetical protein